MTVYKEVTIVCIGKQCYVENNDSIMDYNFFLTIKVIIKIL